MKRGNLTQSEIIGVHATPAPHELIEIETKSGQRITVTPNHPLAVDRPEGQVWVQADDIAEGERIYGAKHFCIPESVPLAIDLLPDTWRVADPELIEEAWQKLKTRYGSWLAARRALPELPQISQSWPLALYRDICKHVGDEWHQAKKRIRRVAPPRGNPPQELPQITPELLYLLGFITSDGSIQRVYKNQCEIIFTNTEKTLLENVERIYHQVFPDKKYGWREKKDGSGGTIKGRVIVSTRPSFDIYSNNALLGALAHALGVRRADAPRWDLKRLFTLPENHIAAFLAGVFDGDGSIRVREDKGWVTGEAYLCHSDQQAAQHLALLMRRLGVVGHLTSANIYKVVLHGF